MHEAEIYKFPDATEREIREKRGPQVEEGHTRIANELYEQIMIAPFTLREMRVVLAVIRLTYGWNRKQARVTGGILAKLTGMPATKASTTLASLVSKNVVTRHGGSRSPVSLNKHADQWILEEPVRVTPPPHEKSRDLPNRTSDPNRYQSYQNGKSESYQNGNASKDKKDKPLNPTILPAQQDHKPTPKPQPKKPPEPEEIPDWLPPAAWQDFLDHRKSLKAPMSELARTKAINKLDQLRREGNNPCEVLEQSIVNGWKGVFEVKGKRQNGKPVPPNPQADMDDCAGRIVIPDLPPDADTWGRK